MSESQLINAIHERIALHHNLYTIPVADLMWEEILAASLVDIGYGGEWEPGSHKIGADITGVKNFGDISCKTGAWQVKPRKGETTLLLNGSRTTKYPTIEEKIEFLSQKKEDHYFCLARNKRDWVKGKLAYKLCIFPTLPHHEMEWEQAGNGKDWYAENEQMRCKITRKMSDQLWTELHTAHIDRTFDIVV